MTGLRSYLTFIRDNAPFLLTGALLSFLSSFGQTFFISIFGGEIRADYGLTNGEWGLIYMVGTGASAALMVFAGGLADRFRVRTLGIVVVWMLALACLAMAFNPAAMLLPVVIFALRFTGQGMTEPCRCRCNGALVCRNARPRASHRRLWFHAGRGGLAADDGLAEILYRLADAVRRQCAVLHAGKCGSVPPVAAGTHAAIRGGKQPVIRHERPFLDKGRGAAPPDVLGHGACRHVIFGFGTAFWFHQAHFAEIKGWSHLSLVAVFPLGTAALLVSTIIYGWAVDRFGAVRLLPVYLLPLVVAFVLHWYAPSLWWTAIAIILMGLAGGGQATILNACWAELYGTRHIGAIKSVATALMVLGSAIGPGFSGWLIDIGVGFEVQQLGYAALFAFASLIMIMPVRHARIALAAAAAA